jgi:acetyl esterase/lipase
VSIALVVIVLAISARRTRAQTAATSPTQPASGPGGAEYKCQQVVAKMYGTGATRYWIFEPAGPAPEIAPLIIFNHGWSAMEPKPYGAWIDHIVKRGNIVVYPVYQDSLRTPPGDFTPNAATGISAAIAKLQNEPGHVKPDLSKVAFVGHSMGGVISANLAAQWHQLHVPRPLAVMAVQPGNTWAKPEAMAITLADLSSIDKDTLLVTVSGDRDRLTRDIDAQRIFKESTQVLPQNKNYVELVSDDHGQPPLIANHFAPCAPNRQYVDASMNSVTNNADGDGLRSRLRERMRKRQQESGGESPNVLVQAANAVDALDFYGTWKLFDGLCDAAFTGTHREYALGNAPQQRFMGKWSDGTPVKELQVTVATTTATNSAPIPPKLP